MTQTKKNKGNFTATVIFNKKLGPTTYSLSLEFACDLAKPISAFKPGQFIELDISKASLPEPESIPAYLRDKANRHILLRRPFSPCSVEVKNNHINMNLIYSVIGPATLRMTTLTKSAKVSIIGPLGNGFSMPDKKTTALLVSGGVGSPPIQHLATALAEKYSALKIVFFAGTAAISNAPFETEKTHNGFIIPQLQKHNIDTYIATDNGSAGHHGFITESLQQWLDQNSINPSNTVIYTCGPEPMLKAVAHIARSNNIECQVSLERTMACGLGLCQSCAVEVKIPESTETQYKMCCTNGPVFNAEDIIF